MVLHAPDDRYHRHLTPPGHPVRYAVTIENLDIGIAIVDRAIESQKFAQSVLIIILIGQLQDRLTKFLAEPYQCRTHQFITPLA